MKTYVMVLIRSTLPRRFWWIPTTYVSLEKEENYFVDNLLPGAMNYTDIFMPLPAFGRCGAYSFSPWCYVSTILCAYVTFVTGFKFTCKFRCKFTSAFLLQLITFIPSGLESWNFVWHLPTSRPFNVWYRCSRVMPLGGAWGLGEGIFSSYFFAKHCCSLEEPNWDPSDKYCNIYGWVIATYMEKHDKTFIGITP